MERINDLKLIKKHYNEKMSHLCRELFPSILETPGLLYELLIKNFAPSRFLYEDIVKEDAINSFKDFIYSQVKTKKEQNEEVIKTPAELLDEAGYILYECKTEKDIQKFKKYYAPGEELCTFKGGRLDRCYVFFAVKKNVDEIRRENFENPERQDLYGTSVISIQFTRDSSNTVSIKNRYNHTVDNPDATFSNNLDNIMPGLTESFNKTYNLRSKKGASDFELPKYVRAKDGKFYKYNFEDENIYYCPNNIIIDNFEVKQYDPAKCIVFEGFILDLQNKTLKKYDDEYEDCFSETICAIEKLEQKVDKENGNRTITINDDIIITLDSHNRILKYVNDKVKNIGDNFLSINKALVEISLPCVEKIGDCFLYDNQQLAELSLPNVKEIGDGFLTESQKLTKISLPCVEKVGRDFLYDNRELIELSLPEVKIIGAYFLGRNRVLTEIDLPKVKTIDYRFLSFNQKLTKISLPCVEKVGNDFLYNNSGLIELSLPNVKEIGDCFLCHNKKLTELSLPFVEKIGDYFLCYSAQPLKYFNGIEISNKEEQEKIINRILMQNRTRQEVKYGKNK